MKIVRTTATLLAPSARTADLCRIEITSDDGATGVATADASLATLVPTLANEWLTGADPRAVASHWQRLCAANARSHGALGGAAAALDCALWDLKAKLAKVPLWRALGALAPRVNVHARLAADVADDAVAATCRVFAARGIRGVVVESTLTLERDARRLIATRDAVGAGAALMLDLDSRLGAKEAIGLVANLEHTVDLTWIEAPAARADVPGLRRASESVRAAVCAGAHFADAGTYLPHFTARSLDIVQIDTARVGISGALAIADAAFGLELPVILSGRSHERHVMLAAALPYCASVEVGAETTVDSGWGVAA